MTTRVRPRFRRLAIVAAIVLLPVAAHSLWDYIELRRVIREIKDIQARNEPVTERQAGRGFRTLQPDEERSARSYLAAAILASPVRPDARRVTAPLAAHLAGHTPPKFDYGGIARTIAGTMDAAAEPLRLAREANALPFKAFNPGSSYSYRTSELLRLLDLQSLYSTHLSLTGSGDAAVDAVVQTLTSRRMLQDEPGLVNWPHTLGFDVSCLLSFSTASADGIRRLEEVLIQRVRAEDVRSQTLLDRAVYIERAFFSLYGGTSAAPADSVTGGRLNLGTRIMRPWIGRVLVDAIRDFNRLVDAAGLPWPEKGRRMSAIYRRMPSYLPDSPATYPLPSWWERRYWALDVIPRERRQLVLERVAAVTVAVVRYRREHGRLPESLEQLAGTSPADPMDPWSGQPLRYRSDEHSFTVYSIGPDEKDDGGDLVSEWRTADERGYGVRRVRGKDIGIRVLLKPQ